MKRHQLSLEAVADVNNLAIAAHMAARAKRSRPAVRSFFADLPASLSKLSKDILAQRVPYGEFRTFSIRDPKPRLIHAACFPDRVLHHALMNFVSPVLDKAMTTQSFACREGYGVHRAAEYALGCVRRIPYVLKLDVKAYFASISHQILLDLLARKFKGKDVLRLISRIVTSYQVMPGYGLPIGSLCSQHFANYYLDALDRELLAKPECAAMLRYMDDLLIFTHSRHHALVLLNFSKTYLLKQRALTLKDTWQLSKTQYGVTFCGYRLTPKGLGLSARRRKRYQQGRRFWEAAYARGQIDSATLQRNGAAVQSILQGCNTRWQHTNLALHPAIEV